MSTRKWSRFCNVEWINYFTIFNLVSPQIHVKNDLSSAISKFNTFRNSSTLVKKLHPPQSQQVAVFSYTWDFFKTFPLFLSSSMSCWENSNLDKNMFNKWFNSLSLWQFFSSFFHIQFQFFFYHTSKILQQKNLALLKTQFRLHPQDFSSRQKFMKSFIFAGNDVDVLKIIRFLDLSLSHFLYLTIRVETQEFV